MQSVAQSAEVLSVGCDWLTATARSPVRQASLITIGEALSGIDVQEGNHVTDWKWKGYTGRISKRVRVGCRDDSTIVQVTSGLAYRYWQDIYPRAERITRADFQVTARTGVLDRGVAKRAWDALQQRDRQEGRPPNYQLITNSRGGDTLNVGKRSSLSYARLYDKSAQSPGPDYARSWRYEVEYHAEAALHRTTEAALSADPENEILRCVYHHFRARGIDTLFGCNSKPPSTVAPKDSSDDCRKLEWIGTQVRCVLLDLRKRYPVEYLQAVSGLLETSRKGGAHLT